KFHTVNGTFYLAFIALNDNLLRFQPSKIRSLTVPWSKFIYLFLYTYLLKKSIPGSIRRMYIVGFSRANFIHFNKCFIIFFFTYYSPWQIYIFNGMLEYYIGLNAIFSFRICILYHLA